MTTMRMIPSIDIPVNIRDIVWHCDQRGLYFTLSEGEKKRIENTVNSSGLKNIIDIPEYHTPDVKMYFSLRDGGKGIHVSWVINGTTVLDSDTNSFETAHIINILSIFLV